MLIAYWLLFSWIFIFTGKLVEIYRYLPTCLVESLYYWLVQASCLLIKGKPAE
jgi:hypothetical protein